MYKKNRPPTKQLRLSLFFRSHHMSVPTNEDGTNMNNTVVEVLADHITEY